MGFFLNGAEFAEFIEFSKFRESTEAWIRINLTVFSVVLSLWLSGRVPVSHTGGHGFEPSNLFKIILFLSLNSLNSVKTFRKNSNTYVIWNVDIIKNSQRINWQNSDGTFLALQFSHFVTDITCQDWSL